MPSTRKPSHAAEELERRKKTSPTKSIIMGLAVVIAVIAVGYALYMRFGKVEEPTEIVAPPTEEIKSIAVLPFINMSDDTKQDYFCDGIADAILNALTHVGDLRVIARSSSFAFRGDAVDIREVGKQLDVEWVLEGSLQKAGNELRITAQLINVSDLSHVFSNVYERDLVDVFAIQDSIALAIVDTLKVKLLDKEKAAIEKRYTEDSEAYQLYLLGRYFWDMLDEENLKKGLDYFQQAIEKDPNYALAYVGIADSYSRLGLYNYMPKKEAYSKAREAAEKALEIDDTLSEAYTSLGFICTNEYEWNAAENAFKKAIELNPNYALTHWWYKDVLLVKGRTEEAIAEFKRSQELDPLPLHRKVAMIYNLTSLGRYDEAMELFHKAVEIDPNDPWTYSELAYLYADQGNFEKAVEASQKHVELSGNSTFALSRLGHYYALSGERDKAEQILHNLSVRKTDINEYFPLPLHIAWIYVGLGEKEKAGQILNEIIKQKNISTYWIALFYLKLGDDDKAFEFLDKALEERRYNLIYLPWSNEWNPIRSDPRFKALLKKMGLE